MRLLISSRNTLIPGGLQSVLSETHHVVSAHYYQSTDQLVAKAILERSELVILDKSDADIFLFPEIRYIRERLPRLKIIFISGMEYADFMQQCYTDGIEGYLIYDCSAEEVQEAIDAAERGTPFYCQKILSVLLPRLTRSAPAVNGTDKPLTDRELEIAQLIAEGKTNKQIGDQLCISPHTVHTHRKSLMKKLGVSSAREVTLMMLSRMQDRI